MAQPSAAYLLSRMTGLLVFAPAINADICMLNLVACIADETKRRRALAASETAATASEDPRRRPLISVAQKAIVVGTCVSIFADLLILYSCVHSTLDNAWSGFPKWMLLFNVVKRLHSIIAVHISFLRMQVVTGRFRPKRSSISRNRSGSRQRTTLQRITGNLPALLSTLGYTVVSFLAVGFQAFASFDNRWDGKAIRQSGPFALYRIVTFIGTSYLTLVALYTDTALISLSTKLYEAGRSSNSAPPTSPRTSSSRDAVAVILSPVVFNENRTSTAADPPTITTTPYPTPFSIDPLQRVKKYYNHWINLCYEVLLFFAYVVLSVAYFFDSDFIAGVFVEQALMSIVALNGYVLLHAALKDADTAAPFVAAAAAGVADGVRGTAGRVQAKPWGEDEPHVDDGALFGSASSSRPFNSGYGETD